MKKVLLGVAVLLLNTFVARADVLPDFKTLPDYTLKCEHTLVAMGMKSMLNGAAYVTLHISPSKNSINTGEADFQIAKAAMGFRFGLNQYGNRAVIPFVQILNFRDTTGKTRTVYEDKWSLKYTNGDWAYSCVPVEGSDD